MLSLNGDLRAVLHALGQLVVLPLLLLLLLALRVE